MEKPSWIWKETAEVIGVLGIIAGIFFLGFELRQNNELLQAQARSDREVVRREAFQRYLDNPALIEATVKARNGEPLTDQEADLLTVSSRATLWAWRYIYNEYREGLLDEAALPIVGWQVVFEDSPALSETWSAEKIQFEPEFVEWMERTIVNR